MGLCPCGTRRTEQAFSGDPIHINNTIDTNPDHYLSGIFPDGSSGRHHNHTPRLPIRSSDGPASVRTRSPYLHSGRASHVVPRISRSAVCDRLRTGDARDSRQPLRHRTRRPRHRCQPPQSGAVVQRTGMHSGAGHCRRIPVLRRRQQRRSPLLDHGRCRAGRSTFLHPHETA